MYEKGYDNLTEDELQKYEELKIRIVAIYGDKEELFKDSKSYEIPTERVDKLLTYIEENLGKDGVSVHGWLEYYQFIGKIGEDGKEILHLEESENDKNKNQSKDNSYESSQNIQGTVDEIKIQEKILNYNEINNKIETLTFFNQESHVIKKLNTEKENLINEFRVFKEELIEKEIYVGLTTTESILLQSIEETLDTIDLNNESKNSETSNNKDDDNKTNDKGNSADSGSSSNIQEASTSQNSNTNKNINNNKNLNEESNTFLDLNNNETKYNSYPKIYEFLLIAFNCLLSTIDDIITFYLML